MSDESTNNIITAIISIIGTGLGVKFFDYLRDNKKEGIATYKDLLERVEKELIDIKSENRIMREEIDDVRSKNKELQGQMILLQSADNLYPFPMWLKSPNGTMLVINDEYVRIFNIKKSEYIGKTDVEIWGEEVGTSYWNNDLKILKGKKLYVGRENVPTGSGEWLIIKFPLKIGDIVIGLKGYAIPINKNDIDLLENLNKYD